MIPRNKTSLHPSDILDNRAFKETSAQWLDYNINNNKNIVFDYIRMYILYHLVFIFQYSTEMAPKQWNDIVHVSFQL